MLLQMALYDFLWLSDIPLQTQTHTHTYHIFFIHLYVGGHLGCFFILAIVNSTAMNFGMFFST